MNRIALAFVTILVIMIFMPHNSTFGQGNLLDQCDAPRIVFGEYDAANDVFSMSCLRAGKSFSLLHIGYGKLSPSRNYLVYLDHYEISKTMSLYLYDMNSNTIIPLRQGDGHIAIQWIPTDKLLISIWREPIDHISDLEELPYYRALFNPETSSFSKLIWPAGIRGVQYIPQQDRFVLWNLPNGVFSIGQNGLLQPIELPYLDGSAPVDLDVSEDGSTIVYPTSCPTLRSFSCFVVYDVQTDHFETIKTFDRMGYSAINSLQISSTARFVAFDLDNHLAVYDLDENCVSFDDPEHVINGYQWAEDEEFLFIAQETEGFSSPMESYLYTLNVFTNEITLLTNGPVWWTEFY